MNELDETVRAGLRDATGDVGRIDADTLTERLRVRRAGGANAGVVEPSGPGRSRTRRWLAVAAGVLVVAALVGLARARPGAGPGHVRSVDGLVRRSAGRRR